MQRSRRKRRLMVKRKRTLDANVLIDYKQPDTLRRFITDRGKIIPRRISGATASQQRKICTAIKRARYLSLLPYSVNHRTEKGFVGEMSAVNAAAVSLRGKPGGSRFGKHGDRPGSDRPGSDRPGGDRPDRSEGRPPRRTDGPSGRDDMAEKSQDDNNSAN